MASKYITILIFFSLLTASLSRAQARSCQQLFLSKIPSTASISEGDNEPLIELGKEVQLDQQSPSFMAILDIPDNFYSKWQLSGRYNRDPLKLDIGLMVQFYRKNFLHSLGLIHHTLISPNPLAFVPFINFNFLAKGNGTSGKALMIIETVESLRLSHELGKKVFYQQEFLVPANMDWVQISLDQFRPNNTDSNLPSRLIDQDVKNIGFKLKNKKETVIISDEVKLSLDIPTTELNAFIDHMSIDGSRVNYEFGKYVDGDKVKKSLKKFFVSMANPVHQQWAIGIAKKGQAQINQELSHYGWQAQTRFNDKVSMRDIIESVSRKDLFIEDGDFGVVHGQFAHHAQILSGLRGLSKEDAVFVLGFISRYIGDTGDSNRWTLWNIFFDARGNTMNSNRYWRDLLYH